MQTRFGRLISGVSSSGKSVAMVGVAPRRAWVTCLSAGLSRPSCVWRCAPGCRILGARCGAAVPCDRLGRGRAGWRRRQAARRRLRCGGGSFGAPRRGAPHQPAQVARATGAPHIPRPCSRAFVAAMAQRSSRWRGAGDVEPPPERPRRGVFLACELACMRACEPACMRAYMLACARACVRERASACARLCVRACMRARMRA